MVIIIEYIKYFHISFSLVLNIYMVILRAYYIYLKIIYTLIIC